MNENKRHTPDGFKDYLPRQCLFKQNLKQKIENTFFMAGYLPISSPMLEYAEVFEGAGSAPPRQMYRLISREGDILTLRSDMTPPVARIAAMNFTPEDAPMRFYYTENAFRRHQSYKGKAGEYTESGVELIGAAGVEADAEVAALAVNCLLAAGLEGFKFYLGHAGFLKGALGECGLPGDDGAEILRLLSDHNIVGAERLLQGKTLPDGVRALSGRLNMLTGGMGMLNEASGLVHNGVSARAISDLRRIFDILSDYGASQYILFDLSMTGTLDYYTGAVFRGYSRGAGYSLLDGGRYDNLVKQYGQDFPAVGFSLKLDNLAAILDVGAENAASRVLVAYSGAGRKAALKKAACLREQGERAEVCLTVGGDRAFYEAEAKKRGIPRVLFFEGGES